jgi:hypothetical protein
MDKFVQSLNLAELISRGSPAMFLLVALLLFLTAWKVPSAPAHPSFKNCAAAFGIFFALPGFFTWSVSWELPRFLLGFLAFIHTLSLGAALYFFAYSFTPRNS